MNSWRDLAQRIWARATELVAMVVGVDRVQIDLTNSDSDSNHVSVRGANTVIVLSSGSLVAHAHSRICTEAETRYHTHTQRQKTKCSQQKNMVSDEEEDEKKEECDPSSFSANKANIDLEVGASIDKRPKRAKTSLARTSLATKIAGAKEAVVQTPALQDNERGEERAEARKGRTTSVKVEGCAAMRTSFPHKPSPAARDRFQGSVLGERRAYLKAFQDRTSDDHSCRYSFSISYAGRWTYWRRTRGARLLYASGARISICGARMICVSPTSDFWVLAQSCA